MSDQIEPSKCSDSNTSTHIVIPQIGQWRLSIEYPSNVNNEVKIKLHYQIWSFLIKMMFTLAVIYKLL
jgi:hypothetical protein